MNSVIINLPQSVLPASSKNFREEKGRKLVRAISAESIYHCMLLFLDHILYSRVHFVHDMLCTSQAVLAINIRMSYNAAKKNPTGNNLCVKKESVKKGIGQPWPTKLFENVKVN